MTTTKLSISAIALTTVLGGCGMEQEQVGSESAAARWGNGLVPFALPTSMLVETISGPLLSYVTHSVLTRQRAGFGMDSRKRQRFLILADPNFDNANPMTGACT